LAKHTAIALAAAICLSGTILPFRSVTLGTFNHPWILAYLAQILATPIIHIDLRKEKLMLRKMLVIGLSLFLVGCSLINSNQPTEPSISLNPSQPEETDTTTPEISESEIQPTTLPSIPDECGNPYYPIVDGSQRIYNGPSGEFSQVIQVNPDKTFTIDVKAPQSNFLIKGQCTDAGIVLLDVPDTSLSVSDESNSATMTTTSNEGITLPNEIQVGDTWSQTMGLAFTASEEQTFEYTITTTYTAIGYEEVTVPAGKFNALKIEQKSEMGGPTPMIQLLWYAQGVGNIKTEITLGEEVITTQLISFTNP
jgi:hypothetical protein